VFGDAPAEQSIQVSLEVNEPSNHTKLLSIRQASEHPSPFLVFPSSQSSVPSFKPSPQLTTQVSLSVFGVFPSVH
jgi:hypothetical protein